MQVMNRKVIGIVVAMVLALVGTVALVAYVSQAEERALAGEEVVEVYVVTTLVPAGTPAEDLEPFLTVEKVPAKVRAAGAVESLPGIEGTVASVDLLVGEQLVDSRMVERSELVDRTAGVNVPDDMVEVTVELERQRAIGGLIEPGQTVAVFSSFEPFELNSTVVEVDGEEVALPQSVAAEVDGSTPNSTELILHKVLVTAVQLVPRPGGITTTGDAEVDRLTTAPEDGLLVTLAVRPLDAERVVFTQEFGFLWLAVERDTVPGTDDPIQTRGSVYDDQVPVQ
jgi:pilus assembly protein CpaB